MGNFGTSRDFGKWGLEFGEGARLQWSVEWLTKV